MSPPHSWKIYLLLFQSFATANLFLDSWVGKDVHLTPLITKHLKINLANMNILNSKTSVKHGLLRTNGYLENTTFTIATDARNYHFSILLFFIIRIFLFPFDILKYRFSVSLVSINIYTYYCSSPRAHYSSDACLTLGCTVSCRQRDRTGVAALTSYGRALGD